MHTPSSGGSLSSPDPSPPPVSATAQTSSTLGKSAPIPTKVVSTMPAAGSDASSDLSELSSEAGGSEPPNTIRRRVKERNRDPHSIQSSDDDDEEEEQEDDDDDDQDDSDSTDRPFAPRGAARRTQANVREREKRKASSVPKQNPRASSSRTRSPAKSITAKNKQSQHQNNKPVTAPARPTSHRRQKSNNTNYSSSTAAHPQSSSSNGISHNHNHNHRTTSPSAFAQSANYAGMVDASSDNDDPSSNTRSSRRKKRGFVPGAMWDWAIKKPNSKKENSKHSTGADSSKSPADEDDEQEEEPPTPGAASHGIATLPDERDEDVKPDIQALDLTLADQKISQATNESNTSSATAVSITANNENHVAVPIAVKSVDCASPSMQKAKLEDGKSDPNLPAKGNGPVPPPCVNGVLPSADQSDAMDIDEPTEAHTASSDNPVKEPENGQGLDVLAAMAGLSDVTSNAPADATSREDKTGGDKVDSSKAMTTKEEGNQKGADDDPDEDEEEEEEEEGSGDKDKDNDREQDDENDNGPDPDEDDEVEEVEDEAEEEEEDTAKTKKVEDDTSTAPPAEIEVDHAPEEQEEQEEPEPDVDNEQELEGEPEIDRAAADAADEVEAETEIQPTQRAEALDILATMEIKFALLREKIYVDKMEEIAREEEMILNGSHPEYLHLLGELQQRRDRKLNLASVKRAREEEFIHLRRRNEERAVWSWWNEIQETTRDEMVRDANAKRRRLDREKRTLEHPRLVRSIPQPPTSHVEVPPNQTLKQTLKQHTTHFQRYPSSSSHPRETPGILPISAKEIAADLELLNPRRYSASGGSGGHHVHRTSSSIGPAPSHMNQYVPPPPPPSNSISGHYGSHSSSHGYAGPSGSSQGRYIPPASYGQVVDAAAAAANPGSGSGGYSHMGYPDGAYPPPPPLQHHYGGHPPNQHSYGPPPPSSQQPYPPPPAQQGLQPQPHHYPQSGSSQQPPLPPPSLSPMPPQNGSTYSHPPPRTNGWPNGTGSAKDGKVVIDLTGSPRDVSTSVLPPLMPPSDPSPRMMMKVEPLPSDSRPPSSLRQHGSSGSVHLPPPPRPQSAFQQPASSQMSPPANGVLSPPGPPPPLTPRPMTSSSNPGRITSPTASYFGSPSRMSTSGGGLGLSPPRRTSAATPQPQSQSLQRQQSSPMVPLKRAPTPLISGGSKVGSQGMVFTSTIPPPLPPLVSERAGGDGAP